MSYSHNIPLYRRLSFLKSNFRVHWPIRSFPSNRDVRTLQTKSGFDWLVNSRYFKNGQKIPRTGFWTKYIWNKFLPNLVSKQKCKPSLLSPGSLSFSKILTLASLGLERFFTVFNVIPISFMKLFGCQQNKHGLCCSKYYNDISFSFQFHEIFCLATQFECLLLLMPK